MADGTFDSTGSGLYTPDAQDSRDAPGADLSDQQLLEQYRRQFEATVGEYPTSTVLTAFGVGLGLGAALGVALVGATRKPTTVDRAELVGRRLLESLRDVIPDGVSKYLD